MSEVHYKSATELISLLDVREIGARELLDCFLDRVERHNPAFNAIIWQDAERARAEADASDRRRPAGEDTGLLDGLPAITVNGRTQPVVDQLFWAGYPCGYYLPSTVAPIGLTDGLPVGIQIVGRQYDDLTCLHMAGLIEEGYYRFTPPPGY